MDVLTVELNINDKLDAGLAVGKAKLEKFAADANSLKINYGESEFNNAVGRVRTFGSEAEKVSRKLDILRGVSSKIGIGDKEIDAISSGIELINTQYAKTAATATAVGTEGTAAFTAIGTTGLAAFGAVALAGLAVVKVTENIRKEAEKRLALEEKISAAYGEQYSALYKIGIESDKRRRDATRDRDFDRTLETLSPEQLQSRIKTTEALQKNTGDASRKAQYGQDLLAFEKQLAELDQKALNAPQLTYEKQAEFTRKSYEDRRNAEERFARETAEFNEKQAKKRLEDLEKAKTKIEELGKRYKDTFDGLFTQSNGSNPFASIFSESDKAIDKLRENLKNLSPELRAIAEQLQAKSDSNKLFETRIDNSLDVFGLRDQADNFRNPKTDSLVDKKRFDEIVQQNISQGNFFNGNFGNYGSDISNKAGGFDKLSDAQKRDIYEVATLSNLQNNPVNPQADYSGFGANPTDVAGFLARQRAGENPDSSLQERLQKQIDIVSSFDAKTPEEKALADKKLIAITAGLDPSKLTSRERDVAASAREREAARRETAEKDAEKDRKKQIELQTRIAENQEKLLQLAEKEGLAGIDKLLVEIKDSPTTKSTVQRANPSDTAKQMDLSGTYFEQSRRK